MEEWLIRSLSHVIVSTERGTSPTTLHVDPLPSLLLAGSSGLLQDDLPLFFYHCLRLWFS